MFILKSTHKLKMQELQSQLDELSVRFSYQQSAEQALRNNLYSQIEDLKRFAFPLKAEPTPEVYEADAVISNSQKPYTMTEEEQTRMLEGEREMDLLLSGNYDTDLLN